MTWSSPWKYPLVRDTISQEELSSLGEWIKTSPKLTIGGQVKEFEDQWSDWLGTGHTVAVNSGSSANLAMVYALLYTGRLKKGDRVGVPAVSWVTTVAPLMQLGLEPVLVDAEMGTLGLCPDHLRRLAPTLKCVVIVHILGFPCQMTEILGVCKDYDLILLEDSCESVGSVTLGQKTGTFGLMSTFSTYYGHHASTIEGGMICTQDSDLADTLRMIRSHGWSRDVSARKRSELQQHASVDSFRGLYTFYLPGFNLRPTEVQGFLGQLQMKKLDTMCDQRRQNLQTYDNLLRNPYWKIQVEGFCSNFAYPVITDRLPQVVKALTEAGVESRPLVCGSIARQPFWTDVFPETIPQEYPVADLIHHQGLYLPNNHEMREGDVVYITNVLNKVLEEG